jgi:hypothetical protein
MERFRGAGRRDTFALKIPLYALLALGFDPGRTTLLVSSIIMNVAGFALLVSAARTIVSRMPGHRSVGIAVAVASLWYVALGGAYVNLLVRPNIRNFELGLGLFLVARLMLFHDHWTRMPAATIRWKLAGLSIGLGLLFYDDPYFVYMMLPPLFLVFGLRWLSGTSPRSAGDHLPLVAAVGGVVSWRLFVLIGQGLGIEPSPRTPRIIELRQIGTSLSNGANSVLDLANANVFGQPALARLTLQTAVRLVVVVVALGIGTAIAWRRRSADPWFAVLALLPATCVLVYALTDKALTPGTDCYVALVIPECLVLLALVLRSINHRQTLVLYLLVLGSMLVCGRATLKQFRERPQTNPNSFEMTVIDVLRDQGVTRGYGDFWDANIISYLSEFDLDVVPVGCKSPATVNFSWFIDSSRFAPTAERSFFITTERANRSTCPTNEVVAQFGAPTATVQVSPTVQILVFDHDIGEDIRDTLE